MICIKKRYKNILNSQLKTCQNSSKGGNISKDPPPPSYCSHLWCCSFSLINIHTPPPLNKFLHTPLIVHRPFVHKRSPPFSMIRTCVLVHIPVNLHVQPITLSSGDAEMLLTPPAGSPLTNTTPIGRSFQPAP